MLSSLPPSQAWLPRPPLTSRATRDATRATKPTGTERFGGVDHAAAFLPEMTPWFRCLRGVKPSIAVKALAGRRLQRVAPARPPVRPSPRDDSRVARVGPARRRSCTPAGSCVWEAWWALAEPGPPGSGAGRRPGPASRLGRGSRGGGPGASITLGETLSQAASSPSLLDSPPPPARSPAPPDPLRAALGRESAAGALWHRRVTHEAEAAFQGFRAHAARAGKRAAAPGRWPGHSRRPALVQAPRGWTSAVLNPRRLCLLVCTSGMAPPCTAVVSAYGASA